MLATPKVRGFERPDEVREVEGGRLELITLGDLTLGRVTLQPGWHWAEHVGPITGTRSCQSHHTGFIISGQSHAVMDDGTELDFRAGMAFDLPPGHDAWIVGDEPQVSLEFSGSRSWAVPDAWIDDVVVSTILLTDIVDSTATAERLGDQAWRERLAEHHADARRILERFAGNQVKTTGDGILATFASAGRAVMAGLALRDAAEDRELTIRTGIHTGEVARTADDVRGIAVHIAARIEATAEPGEVLLSSTTRELAEGVYIDFEDRGSHELRGVSGARHLYRAEPGRKTS